MTGDFHRDVQPVPLGKGQALPYVTAHGRTTKLRRAIAESGWPAYAVAAAARVPPRILSNYLGGKRIPRDHLVRLSIVLDRDPEDLMEDE